MTNPAKPAAKPSRPNFSSGPCAKRPGWSPDNLKLDSLGRSHRSKLGKARLKLAIDKTRELLKIPADFRIGIMPGSDTGAIEAAFWSMLGARPVDVFAFESFGEDWVTDVTKQLKVDATVHKAGYGQLPDMSKARKDADIIFTWNGTTSGVKVPNADWIAADREGLVFCDATSAVFAMPIDWSKVDVLTYSWQKVLGGEGAHGMLILSPRAIQRLETYTPSWPMPKLFRMAKGGKVTEGIFDGETINTPSMLAVEDYLDALGWVESARRRRGDVQAFGRQPRRHGKVGGEDGVGRVPRGRSQGALQHVGDVLDRRSARHQTRRGGPAGLREDLHAASSKRKARRLTSAATRRRLPGFASGAARRWMQRTLKL